MKYLKLILVPPLVLALAACEYRDSDGSKDLVVNGKTPQASSSSSGDAGGKYGSMTICGAHKAAQFIGQEATEEVRQQLKKAIKPVREVRFIFPNSAVTSDYSNGRLNVYMDENGVIEELNCG